MSRRTASVRGLLLAAVVVVAVRSPAAAQDFKMTRETTTEFGGSLGLIMKLFGGGKPSDEVFSISASGDAARWDRGDQSTIMRYDSLAVDQINHKKKEYFSYKLGDLAAQAQANLAAAQQQGATQQVPDTAPDVQYKVTVSIKPLAGTKEVAGMTAQGAMLTVMAVPEKAKNGIKLEELSSFALLAEVWSSDKFPGNDAMARLSRHAAKGIQQATQVQSFGAALMQAMAQSPALKVSYEGSQAELQKLGHLPVEQTTVFVDLPPGIKLDPEAALTASIAPTIDVKGIAADEAKRSVTNKIGGLFGRKPKPAEPSPQTSTPTTQLVIMRAKMVLKDFGTASLGPSWFAVPEGYKLKVPSWASHN